MTATMNWVAMAGYVLVCSFYPLALYRAFKARSMKGYSLYSLWTLTLGLALILVTTIYFGIWAYIIGNAISLVCSTLLLILHYHYK